MSEAYSLTVQAALGNRFAGILLAAQLYRRDKLAAREAKSLAQLHRAHRWRTHEALSDYSQEGARQEGGRQEDQARPQEGGSAEA